VKRAPFVAFLLSVTASTALAAEPPVKAGVTKNGIAYDVGFLAIGRLITMIRANGAHSGRDERRST
jgi:hypothetical protein